MIEKDDEQLSDVSDAGIVLRGYNYKIVVCPRVYAFVCEMMSRLIAKGIISYCMRQRGRIAPVKTKWYRIQL